MRHALALAACLLALTLAAGCIAYEERLIIEPNLSGTINMEFDVPEQLVALSEKANRTDNIYTVEGITRRFTSVEDVRLMNAKVEVRENHRFIGITLAFEDTAAFGRISTGSRGDTGFLGDLSLSRGNDGIRYVRTVTMRDTSRTAASRYAEQFAQFPWRYSVTLPGRLVDTNGEPGRDGRSASWDFTLADLSAGVITMKAASEPEENGFGVALWIGAVFALVLAGLYALVRRLEAAQRR